VRSDFIRDADAPTTSRLMIWFPAAALGTYLILAWHRRQSSHLFWLVSLAAFFLAVGRGPLPLFVALFAVPTTYLLIRAIKKREALRDFALFALSDLFLLLGLSVHYAATFEWSLPRSLGAGATLVAISGMVRLLGVSRGPGPVGFLFMWQGLFLVQWVSGSASAALIAGALGVLVLTMFGQSDQFVPGTGLALTFLLASVGAPLGYLLIVGLAVFSFTLGERFISAWTLLAAPLSVASHLMTTRFHWSTGLVAAALVILWVVFAGKLALVRAGPGGRLPAALAAVGTAWLLWTDHPELLAWLLYGGVVAVGASLMVSKPSLDPWRAIPEIKASRDPLWLRALGWVAALVAVALEARLILLGLSTDFL
jgi:hypothetical protein